MALWGVVFLVAIAAVAAEPELAIFPEQANELQSGSRIVSGWEAQEGQFPFQISMRMVNPIGGVNACGGTIIHADWGMTAAHCTATRVTMVIRAGTVNLTRPDTIFETTSYYNHPRYDSSRPSVVQPDDIAVLRFNRRLTFSHRIQPVRIQSSNDRNRNYNGVTLTASGWGVTWTQGTSPENMNWVFLTGVTNAFCFASYGGSSIIQDTTICARYYNVTSQSTCSGDSGGALTVVDDDGELSQVGISSFVSGQGCHAIIPAGFVRPGHYHEWIKEVTGIDFDWSLEKSEESSSEETESSEESKSSEESSEESEEVEPTPELETTTLDISEEDRI